MKRTVIGMSAMRIPKRPMPEGLRGRSLSPPPSPRPRGTGDSGGPFGPPVVGSDDLSGAWIRTVSVFNADGIALCSRGPAAYERLFHRLAILSILRAWLGMERSLFVTEPRP